MRNRIDRSVGDRKANAENSSVDVKTVQGYLNIQIVAGRSRGNLLEVSGYINDDTVTAIRNFQLARGIKPTGMVQPNDRTWDELAWFHGPSGMRTSSSGEQFIKHNEGGLHHHVYNDQKKGGNATIGYGHKLHPHPFTADDLEKWKAGIPDWEAELIFDVDLRDAVHAVTNQVDVPLTQNQFDALVDLTFNEGYGNFGNSSVLDSLNEGDYKEAGRRIGRMPQNHSRRQDDQARFETR